MRKFSFNLIQLTEKDWIGLSRV